MFLAVSPVLVYFFGPLYNFLLLHHLQKQVDAIPRYPNADSVQYNFVDERTFQNMARYWKWTILYSINDRDQVVSFYRNNLPKLGWHYTTYNLVDYNPGPDDGVDLYQRNGLSIVIPWKGRYESSPDLVTVTIRYTYNIQFDLRYIKEWNR